MSEDDYRIWSNADLDYEEWKDWMEEEYPALSEDERVAMMYEENGHYLEDERLTIWTSSFLSPFWLLPIWGFGMADAWDIRKSQAAISVTAFTLITTTPPGMWTRSGDLRCDDTHHDGTNHYLYRVYKDNVSQAQKDRLKEKNLQRHSHQSRHCPHHPQAWR